MVKQIARSSMFQLVCLFILTFSVSYLCVEMVNRHHAQASVVFDDPPNPNPTPEYYPYNTGNGADDTPVPQCMNNLGVCLTNTCPNGGGLPGNGQGNPVPDGQPCNAGCGSGGGPKPRSGNMPLYNNNGLNALGGVTQFGNAPGVPQGLVSQTGSAIDNGTYNYIHWATDYLNPSDSNKPTSPDLTRFFRSRESGTMSSFGAGWFSSYDIKLQLFTYGATGDYIIPKDNQTSFEESRPRVFDPNSYSSATTRGKLTYYDANMTLMTPIPTQGGNGTYPDTLPRTVAFIDFVAEDGKLYRFETLRYAYMSSYGGGYGGYGYGGGYGGPSGTFQPYRSTDARLVRMQDKNGYGISVTYPTMTATQVATSYDAQWKIDKVIGDGDVAGNKTLTFTYHTTQYGGRWVVSQIAAPSGLTITYSYSGTRLVSAAGNDGVTATFTYGGLYKNATTGVVNTNPANGTMVAETVKFVDPGAAQGHQRKTVVLTLANLNYGGVLFTQASQLVRSVINDENEVTYHNIPYGDNTQNTWVDVYEGRGKLKRVSNHPFVGLSIGYYQDGWTQINGVATGTIESNYQTYSERSPAPSSITGDAGEVKTYTYLPYDAKSGWWVSQIAHSDGTTETFQYDANYRITRQKDRLGNVTKRSYDAKGNLTSLQVGLLDNGSGGETVTPETATTTYVYYAAGHVNQYLLKTAIDPLGNETEYVYDAQDRLTSVQAPPDVPGGPRATTDYTYDSIGRLASILSPGGWSTTYNYDTRNRVTKITHADGSTDRYFYGTGTEPNLLVKVKDRAGTVTKYEYDLAGRRIKTISSYATMDLADNETLITDPALKVEEVCTYIPGTELKASCVRAGEKTTYVYDYRHRLVETKTQPRVGKILASKTVFKDNKLFSTEDAYGRKTFYAYRASDAALVRTIQATVPSVSYADFAAVLAATRAAPTTPNPTSLITDYTLDNAGRTVATVDPLGITHTATYDSRGRATEQIAASGTAVAAKTKTVYDLASRPVEVQHPRYFDSTDTNGFNKSRTTMTYTGRGLLASRTESPGTAEVATESYTYNIEGRQLTRVDARGFTWTTVWNTCCGRQQGSFDPYGHGTIVNVDNLGRATHTATVSNVTAHSANYKDPIDAQTLGETTTKYDTRGRVTARTVWLTPLGQIDPNNVPIYTGPPVNDSANPPAAPYGLTTTYSYDDDLDDNTGLDATFAAHILGLSLGADSDGAAVLTTGPAGERTLAINDGLERGVRGVQLDASNAALTSNTSTFDTVVTISGYGDVLETASANALGHTNKSRTDGAGRTIQSLDATSAITAFTYDAGGRRLSMRDPNNVGQDCTYDALGRDLSCTDTAGAVTSRTFNLAGHAKTQVDAKGKTTSMAYDSRGRRVSMTDRINATTTWAFDAAGNELSMTDAESQTTVYGYDNSGLQITIQWPDHVAGQTPGGANYGIEATAYDAAGRKLRSTNQLGDTITHVYDMGSRLLKKEYRTLANSPSGTIASQDTFTHDAGSRMLTGAKGLYSNTVAMAYDQGGRKASESLTIAGQTYSVGTAYDIAGRVSQLTYPDGSVEARTYDSRNLLSTISLGGTNIDSRSYDTGGRLSSETLGNSLVVTRTYMAGDNLPLAISNSVVGSYTYTWDANKNKTGETITGAMANYTSTMGFDDQNRLTSWSRTSGDSQAWTLSAVNDWQIFTNNGTAVARTHGPTHEVLTVGSATITHDSRGNMTADEFAIARSYDVDNKVSQVVVPSGSARGIVGTHTYQYDVLGRRVRKTIGGSSASDIVFAHAGEQIVADYSAGTPASSTSTKYLWGSYIDELVCQAAGSSRFYPHRNQQYSTIALSDANGAVLERYAYTSYGDQRTLDPAGTTVRTTPPQIKHSYTGREYDLETGAYHFRARSYTSTLGRFLTRDPLQYPDGPHTYSGWFASAQTDPLGLSMDILCNDGSVQTVADNSDPKFWCAGRGGISPVSPGYPPTSLKPFLPPPPVNRTQLLIYNGNDKSCDFLAGGLCWFNNRGMDPKTLDCSGFTSKDPLTCGKVTNVVGGSCLTHVFFADHGAGVGGQCVGAACRLDASAIDAVCGSMCANSTIVLGGCNSGESSRSADIIFSRCKKVKYVDACKSSRMYPSTNRDKVKYPAFSPYCSGLLNGVTFERPY